MWASTFKSSWQKDDFTMISRVSDALKKFIPPIASTEHTKIQEKPPAVQEQKKEKKKQEKETESSFKKAVNSLTENASDKSAHTEKQNLETGSMFSLFQLVSKLKLKNIFLMRKQGRKQYTLSKRSQKKATQIKKGIMVDKKAS